MRFRIALVFMLIGAFLFVGGGDASAVLDETVLVSTATGVPQVANDMSYGPVVSADGRFVAFNSKATNLEPDSNDAMTDSFVRDLATGTVTLVSRASGAAGAPADDDSVVSAISADGRYVVFISSADNLHPDADDAVQNVFVRDVVANTTALVNRASGASGAASDGDSVAFSISADGRYVAFSSSGTNLDTESDDTLHDAFVRDLVANTTTLVSRASGSTGAVGDGGSFLPAISDDGRYVAFMSSANNFDAESDNAVVDVFVRDLTTATTTLVSRATGVAGDAGDGDSYLGSISSDGRYVSIASSAGNLDAESDDAVRDVFVRDLTTATTTLVSRATGVAGAVGDGDSFGGSLSADGRYVAFTAHADNLDPDSDDAVVDVFVRDLATGTTRLVSRASGAGGAPGDEGSYGHSLSADGRHVAFSSAADNLDSVSDDNFDDVFVRDLATDTTTLVSQPLSGGEVPGDAGSFEPSISSDGRYVAFSSDAGNLDTESNDAVWDLFVRDLAAGTVTLVSRATGNDGAVSDGHSWGASVSADGRYVAFQSEATNLDAESNDGVLDVFVRDRLTGTTTLVSRATGATGAVGDGDSSEPSISADGRYVAFTSEATTLDVESDDELSDVFVRDLVANTTTLVSLANAAATTVGAPADGDSRQPAISGDGRYVAFASKGGNLDADSDDTIEDVFLRDLTANTTTLVSRATGVAGAAGDERSDDVSISADGQRIVFTSRATNLDTDSDDAIEDVFLRDIAANTTTLVSRASGATGAVGNQNSHVPVISANGRHVAFMSLAENLDADSVDTVPDIFVRDLVANTTTFVSRASGAAGAPGDGDSALPSISGNGRYVAFFSWADNLDPVSNDDVEDVFVRDVLGADPQADLSVNDVLREEGPQRSTTKFVFTVTLSDVSDSPVTVAYSTFDGTARADRDYTATRGSVTFAPGEQTKTISVAVNGDNANEASETFEVRLSDPSGARIGDGTGVGWIFNDDGRDRPLK